MPTVQKQKAVKKRTAKKNVSGPLAKLKPMEEGLDENLKINIYGKSATGKTTLYSTFPGPILVIVCSGLKNPGELKSVAKKDRSKITKFVVEDTEEVPTILDYVKDTGKFKTVVLDHATGLYEWHLKEILGIDELPVQKSWGMASREQYGQASMKTKETMREILNLNANVVIVAQEREHENDAAADSELDMIPYVSSSLSASTVNWLNPACDYIVRTWIRQKTEKKEMTVGKKKKTVETKVKGESEYCLMTGPHPVFCTKFRVPRGTKLPQNIVDPTYEKLMKLING